MKRSTRPSLYPPHRDLSTHSCRSCIWLYHTQTTEDATQQAPIVLPFCSLAVYRSCVIEVEQQCNGCSIGWPWDRTGLSTEFKDINKRSKTNSISAVSRWRKHILQMLDKMKDRYSFSSTYTGLHHRNIFTKRKHWNNSIYIVHIIIVWSLYRTS